MPIAVRYSAFRRKSAGGRRDGVLARAEGFLRDREDKCSDEALRARENFKND